MRHGSACILLKEVAMYKCSVALAALLVVHPIFPICAARAQLAPGAIEMATGDVWPSREELIHVPQEALELPNPISPGDIDMATGDVLPARKKPIYTPREALVPNHMDDQASGPTNR
jgi:hypothetical protein